MQAPASIVPGTLLHDRYRLVGAAEQGIFGQTYLARDIKRANALCVVKEFIPVQQEPEAIETLRQTFQTEAAVLYTLQHPQILPFRPLLVQDGRFYWVREYVEGKSLGILLDEQKAQGHAFAEAAVIALMAQILPALSAIHTRSVVHRNLSLDSVILRQQDQLPILINFGLVKELVARLQLHPVKPEAALGRWGYAPPEQLTTGRVYPHSDLYALAMIAIALLTGNGAEVLYQQNPQAINWALSVMVSSALAKILERMLDPNPANRFPSAEAVLQALQPLLQNVAQSTATQPAVAQPTVAQPAVAQLVDAPVPVDQSAPTQPAPKRKLRRKQPGGGDPRASIAMVAGLALLVAVGAWKVITSVPRSPAPVSVTSPSPRTDRPNPNPATNPIASPAAANKPIDPAALRERRGKLGIDELYFTQLLDEAFYGKNPQALQRKFGNLPEQGKLSNERNAIASNLLDKLETLPPETRRKLGTYRRVNYDQWLIELGEGNAKNSPTLDAIADQQFYQLFPDQKGKTINPRTFGQVWYAIAEAQRSTAKARKTTN